MGKPTIATSALAALPKPEEASPEVLAEIEYANRWGEIKVLTKEQAEATLEGTELEAYNNYHQHVSDDIARMTEIATMFLGNLEKQEGVAPKTKGQRKRDKWAKVQALAAARAK